jgi:hypothetical protein
MKIKFLSREYSLKLEELSAQNIGGLKEKIKEIIKECSSKQNDKILLYHNKIKLPEDPALSLDDESVKIAENSIIYIIVLGNAPKMEEKKTEQSNKQQTPHPFPSPFVQARSPDMSSTQSTNNLQAMVLEQALENPDNFIQTMSTAMPGMTDDQKQALRDQLEMLKKNPQLMNQMLNNSMMNNPMAMTDDQKAIMRQQIEIMKNNPELLDQILNSPMMANLPDDQKAMMKQQIEMMKNNPELLDQMLNNPMMDQMMGNMMNNPMGNMMNNPTGNMMNMTEDQKMMLKQQIQVIRNNPELLDQVLNSPMMANLPDDQKMMIKQQIEMVKNNPELLDQMLNSPMMDQVMRNNAFSPQMNLGGQSNLNAMQQQTPAHGPCCHGFYPPKYVEGELVPQDARDVWAKQLKDLNEMGFNDEAENVKALRKSKGDVSSAVDFLTENRNK